MSAPPAKSNGFRSWFRLSVIQLVWALLAFSLFGYLGRWSWLLELFCHFRLQYIGCAILGGVTLLVLRDFRTPLVALVALAINAYEVLPWYFGKPAAPGPNAPALKLLLSNVYTNNRDTAAILALIARENPDVIVLQEIDHRWEEELKPLAKAYPNFKTVPALNNFGIGVWSRVPAEIQVEKFGQFEVSRMRVKLTVAGKEVALLAVHTVPPVRGELFELRNQQLASAAAWARTNAGPCIILGDLNMTLWSPFHTRLLHDSGLKNARQGFGILPSWPTMIPFMRIPLDQCLVSPGIGVRDIRTGPKVGSDHLPLIVELAL